MFDIMLREFKDFFVDPFIDFMKSIRISPNFITLTSGLCGLVHVYYSTQDLRGLSFVFFLLTRLFDGIDGAYARATNQCTEFGGYLDIIVDFTIYGLTPIGVTIAHPSNEAWIALAILEVTFFVNAAGLFFLSALIEKNKNAMRKYGDKKELTTVRMPPALIEGTESYFFFTLMIWLCEYQIQIYQIFAVGVTITILQRIIWAYRNLD
eukprot:403358768